MEGQRKHLKTWVGELIIEVSSLYSVAEYKDEDGNKSRKGEALAKRYLYGEFGGIPFYYAERTGCSRVDFADHLIYCTRKEVTHEYNYWRRAYESILLP